MNLELYTDSRGYPGTREDTGDWDGGDTAAILGTLLACSSFRLVGVVNMISHLIDPVSGRPRRHPSKSVWYGQPDRFSRDQLIPIICAAVRWGPEHNQWSRDFFKAHKRRWFLTAWNTRKNGAMDAARKFPDLTGPEVWALWVRAYRVWWLRPVLGILDLELLVGAISWRWRESNVTRNHLLVSIACRKHWPTFISRLAWRITPRADLLRRWHRHCVIVGEYPTWDVIRDELRQAGEP